MAFGLTKMEPHSLIGSFFFEGFSSIFVSDFSSLESSASSLFSGSSRSPSASVAGFSFPVPAGASPSPSLSFPFKAPGSSGEELSSRPRVALLGSLLVPAAPAEPLAEALVVPAVADVFSL